MNLLYINLVPVSEQQAFTDKVNDVALKLGTHPNFLMQVMKAESGLRADIENNSYPMHNGKATGLIQFTPDTAISLGTTVAQLKQMSRVQQMDWVYKYFEKYRGKLKTYFDVYLVVFFPAAISHSTDDNWVFETNHIARSAIAKSNPTMDINKDAKVTMGEFKQYLKNTVQQQYRDEIFAKATEELKKKGL